MVSPLSSRLRVSMGHLCASLLAWSAWVGLAANPVRAQAPEAAPNATTLPPVLTIDTAVLWALQNNPDLAVIRQQHGIAAAAVVIAQTYPFNPVTENKIRAANGPESAGITNRVSVESKVFIDVELFGQGTYRRRGACAALTRTEWEIAAQETAVSVRVLRAFDHLVYRREKQKLAAETLRLTEQAAEQVDKLVKGARLRAADLILARSEADDVLAQMSPAQTAVVTATQDLYRALGVTGGGTLDVQDDLEAALPDVDASALLEEAMRRRPDRHAREAAVTEAEAHLQLEKANRFGNPNIGPAYEYDPTRINLIGGQITFPLPVFNTHRGEIMQREAELGRANMELRQTDFAIQQDVQAALARLNAARAWAETYRTRILPNLRTSLQAIMRLFEQGDPGVDVLRVIDTRRKLLRARDSYLDALWEVRQARADLAAAVGDPSLLVPALSPPKNLPAPGNP